MNVHDDTRWAQIIVGKALLSKRQKTKNKTKKEWGRERESDVLLEYENKRNEQLHAKRTKTKTKQFKKKKRAKKTPPIPLRLNTEYRRNLRKHLN